jgi:RHH-type proline utilization regulon transcriptional repressor/proline dehydrogenase/delta 1-pyrroline-5-carboxylate dehydrogenase
LATLPEALQVQAQGLARRLVEALRAKGTRGTVEGLIREYALSSQEGVALMCLAEALLRIPDAPTRDDLIRDKIGTGDWHAHLGHSPSLFVNAATWGLVVTGRLVATSSEAGLSAALTRLIARGGEPLIRRGVNMVMHMMGAQFVTGQTIEEALSNSRAMEARGFRYSYDMLGEAATTADDAARYFRDYEQAIHAIGRASAGRGIVAGPGISVKLSALHPRYSRSQRTRVMTELLARLKALTLLAREYDIGLNIDAEEADRLDLSLDLLDALCFEPALSGWNGIGFVVQAYQKRAPFVLDAVIDLARRSGHRLMLRLVKGAYWDTEIKRAQVDGLDDFPVFTRKIHTDVSYLACARKLLDARDAVFPQFATHNAQTLATVCGMAGEDFHVGDYEFQCLHGMGEPLYEEVVGSNRLNRPCRIYAPVGTHETLLAYLVRRLLENGANTSFVNRINDPAVALDTLIADPVAAADGTPHPAIALPRRLFGDARDNSAGFDFSDEQKLAMLADALQQQESADALKEQESIVMAGLDPATSLPRHGVRGSSPRMTVERSVLNPANHNDIVGHVLESDAAQIDHALTTAAASTWRTTPPTDRAASLFRAADLLESRMPNLLGLIVREAGKSFPNAVAEVREAVDFLRYYAATVRDQFSNATHIPLGPIVCISPWNFPLAIFTGQIAAALAAGNPVLAKPAEETPLIAAQAVAILHEAGIPTDAVQLLPGQGETGAQLVGDPRTQGVMFTGSTDVARLIQRQLAERLGPTSEPIPLIAETGGQNALIVDSSALAEQVVADVLVSAFDSAGQRCSALRVLCLQEDIAEHVLTMLHGALSELVVGNPDRLSTDVGPVIAAQAQASIAAHILAMRDAGCIIHASTLPDDCAKGTFIAPTIIEIDRVAALTREIFGPVLHVLRYRRADLDHLIAEINATGYGLTFGVHTRIDETVSRAVAQANAGNIYVNRNLIGAVVGVQPFGGHGLSGTGPKAGGPLYLRRLLSSCPMPTGLPAAEPPPPALAWRDWLLQHNPQAAAECATYLDATPAGVEIELPGPVGERNVYATEPRGTVLCVATDEAGRLRQISAALATGNRAVALGTLPDLPSDLQDWITMAEDHRALAFDAVLFDGDAAALIALARELADRDGPVVTLHRAPYRLDGLVRERSISTNTAAAGGNASLMAIG